MSGQGQTIPDVLPPPQWVESGAREISGLDLLALRAPAQRIGNSLLDGITTVTPTVRYLGLVCWIPHLYGARRGPDEWKPYATFARSVEAAFALGNLLVDRSVPGLVGRVAMGSALDSGEDPVPLKNEIQQPAVNLYAGTAEQLGLLSLSQGPVPRLTRERGAPLAAIVDQAVRTTTLGARFAEGGEVELATREELLEFGGALGVGSIPLVEREFLLDCILPRTPATASEHRRVASYAAFLTLVQGSGGGPDDRSFFSWITSPAPEPDPHLAPLLDLWVLYGVRDILSVAHEYAFREALAELQRRSASGGGFVRSETVLGALLADTPPLERTLRDLGVLPKEARIETLSFRDLESHVLRPTSDGITEGNGVRRWIGGLSEEEVIQRTPSSGPGVVALLPVAWLLAERRARLGVDAGIPAFDVLSRGGPDRLGLKDTVFPRLDRYRREDPPLLQVIHDLLYLTVEQHLRTAWSRLRFDSGRDVSLILADGDQWLFKKGFRAGRTASRIDQVRGWLTQLGACGPGGLTPLGETLLSRARETISAGFQP